MLRNLLLICISFCIISFGASAQMSVGIIGSATPGGWDEDTDMTLVNEMDSIWSIDITLFDGLAKFRADDDWVINWGSADFPRGIGEQDGADIPVFAGDYTITINTKTGEYYFDVDSDIGIIGSATPGLWDEDTDMFKDQMDPNKFFVMLDLVPGEAKFRKDDDWAVNWGSADFPSGIGVQDGDNIPVDAASPYFITLDTMSGEYNFESMLTYETIGIIGDATPGGWDEDTDLTKDANDPNVWTTTITLIDGAVKFRADNDWVVNWGGTEFPAGTATMGGEDLIVTSGDYFVTFNSDSGEYNFKEIVEYATVGIIGDATPGGWDEDTDLEKSDDDVHQWNLRIVLNDGEAKFRADNEWIVDWGAGDFPGGIGVQGGANIPITAGEYLVSFNSLSGAYSFTEIVEYGTIGLIGVSGPLGDWENDTPLNKSEDDFNIWTLSSVDLIDYDPDADGGVKFRAENDWAVNWGSEDFPSGIGEPGGPNIQPVAGTYSVWFNSSTGEYIFGEPVSTQEIVNPLDITLFPNPATSTLNIELSTTKLEGQVSMKVIDMTGKIIKTFVQDGSTLNTVDISDLGNGQYMLNIQNDKYIIGKRFSVFR